jgi:hypothetical protein
MGRLMTTKPARSRWRTLDGRHILVGPVDGLAAFKPERERDGVLKVFEIGRIFCEPQPSMHRYA